MLLTTCVITLASCKKEKITENAAENAAETVIASKTFTNITFTTRNAYFSTNGTMTAPVDSNQAKTMTNKIDITFIYNYDYSEAGFFDPKARAQTYYWNGYYKPWLSTGVETKYYSTNLSKTDFDAAQKDQSKIATFFSQPTTIIAPHGIFPTGSCIGGRQTDDPTSLLLAQGAVFIFQNVSSGKKGLLYIRTDQPFGWPSFSSDTKVDIIREN